MSKDKGTNNSDNAKPQGYIALHRALREHWIWEDPVKFQWWVDIIMECNYTDRTVNIGGKLINCKRGESLNSLKTWAKRWMVDTGKVRRFFKLLEKDRMIETVSVVKTTRLKVCNYDTYNKQQQANDTHATRTRHANDTHATPNNKDNKDNKDNKGESTPEIPQTYGSPPEQERIPLIDEVRRVFQQNGGTDEMAEKFFNKHSATGWRLRGSPIVNYVHLVSSFINTYRKIEEAGNNTAPQPINGQLQPNDYV